MIVINRITDVRMIQDMIPHFTFNDESLREVLVRQIVDAFAQRPDSLFVLAARKDDKLVGFVVAQSGTGSSTWVSQAWTKSGETMKIADGMFNRVILWTIGLGKQSIQCQTARDSEAMYRRFGFKELSKTMQHDIDPEITHRLMESMKEVEVNG